RQGSAADHLLKSWASRPGHTRSLAHNGVLVSWGLGKPEFRDCVPAVLGEPDVAIWASRDSPWTNPRFGPRLLDDPNGGDRPDPVAAVLGEPQVPVRPGGNPGRRSVGGGDGELADDSTGGDAPDPVADVLSEPQVP